MAASRQAYLGVERILMADRLSRPLSGNNRFPDDGNGRVRKVRLTRKGLTERAILDSSSNELAAANLRRLTARLQGYRDGRR